MKSLRVFTTLHPSGRVSGTLLRLRTSLCDEPPPAAYGESERSVLWQLEHQLLQLEAKEPGAIERYLFDQDFAVARVTIAVHPQRGCGRHRAIAKATIPLKVGYVWCQLQSGAYRVVLPRFDHWFIVEHLSIAPELIRQIICSALVGESPEWIYEFRGDGDDRLLSWSPTLLAGLQHGGGVDESDDYAELEAVCEQWVQKASQRRLPPVIGLDPCFDHHRRLFDREPPPSILLVGESGVGKTAFVRRLAHAFVRDKRDKRAGSIFRRIWATSSDRIVAGMEYLGMWQKRCLELVEELSNEGDLLFVDRLVDLLSPQADGASIAEVFAPAVMADEIHLIAECTEQQLQQGRERFASFVDRFFVIRLSEPEPAFLIEALERYQHKNQSNRLLSPDGFRRLLLHLDAYRPDMRLPGKAFVFLDWLNQKPGSAPRQLYPADVTTAFSQYSGIPVDLISDEVVVSAESLTEKLKSRIVGQDSACEVCGTLLARFKAGLVDPDRPVGTLFFAGPTGVGKTELAKCIAATLFGSDDRIVRLDMSEYQSSGAAQRLLASGRASRSLAAQVRRQPLCIVLLDEIEKAHPEVFDALLAVTGEGRLTDQRGQVVDFRMTLIIMTSNLGAEQATQIGFGRQRARDYVRSVVGHFRPEFYNRLDHVVTFRHLDLSDVAAIVDLEVAKISRRLGLRRRRLRLTLSPDAAAKLAELAYDQAFGARPLKRTLEQSIVTPLGIRLAQQPGYADRSIRIVTGRCDDPDCIVV